MGIVLQEVAFEGKAPRLEELSGKISERLGLALIAKELDEQIKGDLYEVRGNIAFADFPKEAITVYAYRAGAVRRHIERTGIADMPMARAVQGANEKPGTQTVYVENYVGMEQTLALAGSILLLPLLIPMWALWLVWMVLALPWRIFRAWRILRRTSSDHSAM